MSNTCLKIPSAFYNQAEHVFKCRYFPWDLQDLSDGAIVRVNERSVSLAVCCYYGLYGSEELYGDETMASVVYSILKAMDTPFLQSVVYILNIGLRRRTSREFRHHIIEFVRQCMDR